MKLKMDETTFAVLRETAAEVEVLRTAFVALAVGVISRLPKEEQAVFLNDIQIAAGSLPMRSGISTREGQVLYDEIRRLAPSRAQQLVRDVTKHLS